MVEGSSSQLAQKIKKQFVEDQGFPQKAQHVNMGIAGGAQAVQSNQKH